MSTVTPMDPEANAPSDGPPPSGRGRLRLPRPASQQLENATITAILVVIVLVFVFITPSGTFLSGDNVRNIALDASQLLILAAGMTFLLIAAQLDLSIGAMAVFTAVMAGKVMVGIGGVGDGSDPAPFEHLGLAIAAGAAGGVLVGAFFGLVNGLLAVRAKIPPFIVTLATAGIILGIAQIWTDGINVSGIPVQLQESYGLGSLFGVVPWPVVTAVVITAVLWVVLAKTRFGLRTYAIGANPEAARRAGVNVDRTVLILYVLVGALAGVVGVIDVARFTTASLAGHTSDALNAISAVVIGGTSLFGGRGRMSGTVVGALIPAVLLNGFVIMNVQPFWQNIAVGCVLLLAVYVDSLRRRATSSA